MRQSPTTTQIIDDLDRELFTMIDDERSSERRERRRSRAALAVVGGALMTAIIVLVLSVDAWGWIPTVAGGYGVSAIVVALFAADHHLAHRTPPRHDDGAAR